MTDLTAMPGHLIRRVHQVSMAIFAEECAEVGLTSVQFAALSAIGDNPGVDATRLSSLIAFDRSTLGDVLERLEAKGWVIRTPSPQDKRLKLLSLSPAGATVLADVGPKVERVQQRLLATLPPADRPLLMGLLAQMLGLSGEVCRERS